MGLLDFWKKKKVPEWATYFSAAEYEAFVAAVEDDLRRRGMSFEVGNGVVQIAGTTGPSQLGLGNVAQLCARELPDRWSEVLQRHFDGCFASSDELAALKAKGGDFDSVRSALKIRLYPADTQLPTGGPVTIGPQIPGLLTVLVYDLPSSVASVSQEDFATWSKPEREVFQIAIDNVRSEPGIEVGEVEVEEGAAIKILEGASFFTTSHALLLEEHVGSDHPFGAVVAIPNRHLLLFHRIDDLRVIHAINAMIPMTHEMHLRGPGSLSSDLYWWRTGEFVRMPAEVKDREIHFTPAERFLEEVLQPLAAPKN